MRILVVGAGAVGGYFGGRLLHAGRDVTFLVRPQRAAALAATGLEIRSAHGDIRLPAPPTITADALNSPFDLILLSCKAYDLAAAMTSFAPAVGTNTAILPLLNGMAHLDALSTRFGDAHVLGGQCQISTVLDTEGRILHLSDFHNLSFGERDGSHSPRLDAIAAALGSAGFDMRVSQAILYEMWGKWVFIAAAAGITCLMRASVGDIAEAGAGSLATSLLDECAAIAAKQGFAPSQSFMARSRSMLTEQGSPFTASMLRDIEYGLPTESDHIVGDLLRRSGAQASPILRIVDAHLKAYEVRRAREANKAKAA